MELGLSESEHAAFEIVHRRFGHPRPQTHQGGGLGGDVLDEGGGVGLGDRRSEGVAGGPVLGDHHQVGVGAGRKEPRQRRFVSSDRIGAKGKPHSHLHHPQPRRGQFVQLGADILSQRPEFVGVFQIGPGHGHHPDCPVFTPAQCFQQVHFPAARRVGEPALPAARRVGQQSGIGGDEGRHQAQRCPLAEQVERFVERVGTRDQH